jgi:DNA-binding MarR family transcriptional regulator
MDTLEMGHIARSQKEFMEVTLLDPLNVAQMIKAISRRGFCKISRIKEPATKSRYLIYIYIYIYIMAILKIK